MGSWTDKMRARFAERAARDSASKLPVSLPKAPPEPAVTLADAVAIANRASEAGAFDDLLEAYIVDVRPYRGRRGAPALRQARGQRYFADVFDRVADLVGKDFRQKPGAVDRSAIDPCLLAEVPPPPPGRKQRPEFYESNSLRALQKAAKLARRADVKKGRR